MRITIEQGPRGDNRLGERIAPIAHRTPSLAVAVGAALLVAVSVALAVGVVAILASAQSGPRAVAGRSGPGGAAGQSGPRAVAGRSGPGGAAGQSGPGAVAGRSGGARAATPTARESQRRLVLNDWNLPREGSG